METPKEKADSIIKKFWMKNKNGQDSYGIAVENAKIAVEEIIENQPFRDYGFKYDSIDSRINAITEYWQEVLIELNKL